ncbi:MAG: bis(5'-nucleosyl)-tetraphosphatase (symmetrical) YqeK [Solobacterium sp.]|nr:bis(5'-nucleosyl)-tetraphosphatase (symmetrical) YqeK [Solobacterium sp.]
MRILSVCAPFDPVTQKELEELRRLRKEGGYSLVLAVVKGEGILSREEREQLLSLALKPYRHMHVSEEVHGDLHGLSEDFLKDEEKVRSGYFLQAARGIRKILAEKPYYWEAAVDLSCTKHRAGHSREVAKLSKELAQFHHLDDFLAWEAGLLHDITKAWSKEKGEEILKVYAPEILEYPAPVYHSYTAPVFLKTAMGIQNHQVLHAIETHTLGTGRSPLDEILYIADKIEPTRGYDATKETELAKRDLDAAFELVFQEAAQYREKEK